MLIDLLPLRRKARDAISAKRSLPFVESLRGNYTHRVRALTYYTLHVPRHPPHAAVKCWCGQTILIGGKRDSGQLVADPSFALCATCEGRAIGAGQVGAREIAGRPVIYSPRGIEKLPASILGGEDSRAAEVVRELSVCDETTGELFDPLQRSAERGDA